MPHDVMISHSSQNKAMALKILDRLEAAGIRCWISARDIKPGADYMEEIYSAIEASRAVVLVLCSNFGKSRQTGFEVDCAMSQDKHIIPLRTEVFDFPGRIKLWIGRTQYVDTFPDFDGALSRVISRIKEIVPASSSMSQESTAMVGNDNQSVMPDVRSVLADGGSSRSVSQMSESTVSISRDENPPTSDSSSIRYWFFNVGEDNKNGRRIWEDNRRFGFMSAGTDVRFRRFAQRLRPGDLVFAYLSGYGYVGYGEVTNSAVMVRDFVLTDGTPLLRSNLTHPQKMAEFSDDYDRSEWAVAINWRKTFPREAAVQFSGIFSNPNTVCRLKDERSLEFLLTAFR